MNSDVKPFAKQATGPACRPLSLVRGPAEEPVFEEEVEMLGDKRLDFLDSIELWTEEDGEFIALL
ncbi:MAG TPA: hypothetical protein VGH98_18950 [Gemmatimonadaceae bacterium]